MRDPCHPSTVPFSGYFCYTSLRNPKGRVCPCPPPASPWARQSSTNSSTPTTSPCFSISAPCWPGAATRRTPHLVEDLTQEAFTILWEKSRRASWPAPTPSAGCTSLPPTWPGTSCAPSSGGPFACPGGSGIFGGPTRPPPLEAGLLHLEGVVAPEELDLLRRVYLEGVQL